MNAERLLKHAMQEKLAITICINKVHGTCMYMYIYILYILSVLLLLHNMWPCISSVHVFFSFMHSD